MIRWMRLSRHVPWIDWSSALDWITLHDLRQVQGEWSLVCLAWN